MVKMLQTIARFFVIGALLAVVVPPMPASAEYEDHNVPYGTPVDVRLVRPLSSYHTYSGMQVQIRVMHDVVADGYVVIRRGAHGIAEVRAGDPAQPGGQVGVIMLQLVWVRAVDHSRIGVDGWLDRLGNERNVERTGNTLVDVGPVIESSGGFDVGSAVTAGGIVLQGIGAAEKGGEANVCTGEVIHGKIANAWGVTIASDVPAYGEEDSPIK